MGLLDVKEWLVANFLLNPSVQDVFAVYPDLTQMAAGLDGGVPRKEVSAAIDGNVVIMRTPSFVKTLDGYAECFASQIFGVVKAAAFNVIVFDEPEFVSKAKGAAQRDRDRAGLKRQPVSSGDFEGLALENDDYTLEELERVGNCHDIIPHRPAKPRFFDEVLRRAVPLLQQRIDADPALEGTVILVDGIDPRGADRPIGEPRNVAVWGSEKHNSLFQRAPGVGEGDLKLALIQQRIRDLTEEGDMEMRLHLTITIDTDSFAIELLETARRACEPPPKTKVNGVLCFLESNSKCMAILRDRMHEGTNFLVCDYNRLFRRLQDDVWKPARDKGCEPPTPLQERQCMALIAAGWALAGCDFVKLNGMKTPIFMETLPWVLKNQPEELLAPLTNAWIENNRRQTLDMLPILSKVVRLCGKRMAQIGGRTRKAILERLDTPSEELLQRSIWTVAYWNGVEHRGNLSDFGFGARSAS